MTKKYSILKVSYYTQLNSTYNIKKLNLQYKIYLKKKKVSTIS
jgi:hypothetical protein